MNPIQEHIATTKVLARNLNKNDIYEWLIVHGYFPESYVIPPCFRVVKKPRKKQYWSVTTRRGRTSYQPDICDVLTIQFPKTELTDRTFGIIDPYIHNDIAYHISTNWLKIVGVLFHKDNKVASYSFPVPIDSKNQGRLGILRSGRMIYEFLSMIDDDLASEAYKYSHITKTDIKSFYPSLYTHSIAWAIHGKKYIQSGTRRHDYNLVGNRLDKLFHKGNGDCTNGIPIGPVVSDLAAEIVAAAIDRDLSVSISKAQLDVQVVRFKDDYRIFSKSAADAKRAIKLLQEALLNYHLELNDSKTDISVLPNGLFRRWSSMYHSVNPYKRKKYSWKQFRELYLSVLEIDTECPGTGVIDRFLADICLKDGNPKVSVGLDNLQKVISMLIMLGSRRTKAFPKIVAILEAILKSPFGILHEELILIYMIDYLDSLRAEERRNRYPIIWVSYFLVSNGHKAKVPFRAVFKDPIIKSIYNNRGHVFKSKTDFKLFEGCRSVAKRVTMNDHLEIFNPPKTI